MGLDPKYSKEVQKPDWLVCHGAEVYSFPSMSKQHVEVFRAGPGHTCKFFEQHPSETGGVQTTMISDECQ